MTAKESYRKLRKSSTFAIRQVAARRFKLHSPPYRLVKVSWKSARPFPRTVVSYYVADGIKSDDDDDKKTDSKTYTHLRHLAARMHKSAKQHEHRARDRHMAQTAWEQGTAGNNMQKQMHKARKHSATASIHSQMTREILFTSLAVRPICNIYQHSYLVRTEPLSVLVKSSFNNTAKSTARQPDPLELWVSGGFRHHITHIHQLSVLLTASAIKYWWLGSVVVMAMDSWSTGRRFNSRRVHCRAATLGKLFTPMCLCHQAV